MARIAGIDIPKQKRGVISLTYIYGIGRSRAQEILANAKVDESTKVQDWSDDEIGRIREQVGSYTIEGELRSLLADRENPTVLLRVEETVPIEKAVLVMDVANRNKFKVILAVRPN